MVTTLAQPDVDQLAKVNLIPADWATRLPNQSVPYTSTILFIVRKGNPEERTGDWSDPVKPRCVGARFLSENVRQRTV